jgi:anthranilate phosphoribosyltransferase
LQRFVQVLTKLIAQENLTFEDAKQSLDLILDADVPEQIAAFLALLAAKGAESRFPRYRDRLLPYFFR